MLKKCWLGVFAALLILVGTACNSGEEDDAVKNGVSTGEVSALTSVPGKPESSVASGSGTGAFTYGNLPGTVKNAVPFAGTRMERNQTWKTDLTYVRDHLPEVYKDLYEKIPEQEFQDKMAELIDCIGQLSDEQIKGELSRVLALAGDSYVTLHYRDHYGFPLRFWMFGDGVYVIGTDREREGMLYARVLRMDDADIETVLEQLAGSISHDNEMQLRASQCEMLFQADRLYGLGIIGDKSHAGFTVENPDGTEQFWSVPSVFSGQHGLENLLQNQVMGSCDNVLNDFHYIADYDAMYLEFNVCIDVLGEESFDELSGRMFDGMKQQPVGKMIIDLRSNRSVYGKRFTLFAERLAEYAADHPELRVCVLTGRNSGQMAVQAIHQIKEIVPGIISVGEPTLGTLGNKGMGDSFQFPSGAEIWVAYTGENADYGIDTQNGDTGQDSFIPDVMIEASLEDYRTGNDMVLRYALENT